MPDTTTAGRIYQNPSDGKEIWINIGWYGYDYSKKDREWPEYTEKLSPYLSKEKYDEIVDYLGEKLTYEPCMGSEWATLLCCCTCGICFCPMWYVTKQFPEAERYIAHEFSKQAVCKELDISLRFVKRKEGQRVTTPWLDSNGLPLEYSSKDDDPKLPRSPPPGVSVVCKFRDELPWATEPIDPVLAAPPPMGSPYPPPMGTVQPYPPPQYPPTGNMAQYPPQYPPPVANVSQYPPPIANTSQYPPPMVNASQYPPPIANVSQYPPPIANTSQYPPLIGKPPQNYQAVPDSAPPQYEEVITNQPAAAEHKFCGECGIKSTGSKFCTSCGAPH